MSAPNLSAPEFTKKLAKIEIHESALNWSSGKDYETFWDTCPNARWLLSLINSNTIDKKISVRLATLIARRAMFLAPFDNIAKKTLEMAESWLFGGITSQECEREGVKAVNYSTSDAVTKISLVNLYGAVASTALAAGAPDNATAFACVLNTLEYTNSAVFAVVNEVEEEFAPVIDIADRNVDIVAAQSMAHYKTQTQLLEQIRQAFPKSMFDFYKVLEERITTNNDDMPKSARFVAFEISSTLSDVVMEASSEAMERYDEVFSEMPNLVRQVLKRPAL